MGVFEHFPYANFHELNMDWILAELKKHGVDIDKLFQEIEATGQSVTQAVNDLLNEWLEDGTMQELVDGAIDDNGVGGTVNIRQIMQSFYPYPTSTGARVDVTPTGTAAYYVQGFCKTPAGFAFVRLAPDTNKIDENDISQIFEFGADGTYIRSIPVNVGHGNGMVYYNNCLYVDVGSRIAKIRYSDFSIIAYVEMGGTCPAFNHADNCMYSVDTSTLLMYKYDFEENEITTIPLSSDCQPVYNGSFIKDNIFYGITYMNDLVMIDCKTGKFLGGKHVLTTDVNNIKLLELEDCDCDEDGRVYVLVNQVHFSTAVYTVGGTAKQLRKPGFYIGEMFLDGGGSARHQSDKHIQFHPTDIVVANDMTEAADKNAKQEYGTTEFPFRSLAAASFYNADVRQVNCGNYNTMRGADIYQPLNYANYGLINNLSLSTTYPLAIKGWTGYLKGGAIKITDYGVTLSYCDIASVDIDATDLTDGQYLGYLYNGRAEVIPTGTAAFKMKVSQCELSGSNAIPDGSCTTKIMKYTNQGGTSGNSVTLHTPVIGGARGTRLALLNRAAGYEKYVIYNLYGNTLYGTDGSMVSCDVTDRAIGVLKFTAPFTFDRVDLF